MTIPPPLPSLALRQLVIGTPSYPILQGSFPYLRGIRERAVAPAGGPVRGIRQLRRAGPNVQHAARRDRPSTSPCPYGLGPVRMKYDPHHHAICLVCLLFPLSIRRLVQAMTQGSLWAMDRTTFRRIILKTACKKRKMYETLLETVPMLRALTVSLPGSHDLSKFPGEWRDGCDMQIG